MSSETEPDPKNGGRRGHGTGIGVDASGGPVIDPTANVISLFEAGVKRLDDLRSAETKRQDDMRDLSAEHTKEMHVLARGFEEKLRDAEAKRIDAIRAVDVNAVAVASSRASDQASVLASQVQTSSDALRSLVASTAATLATQQTAALAEITKRLSELERTKYEGAGRSTLSDPQLVELVQEMKRLSASRSEGMGSKAAIAAGALFLGLLIGLAGLAVKLVGS